MKKLFEIPIYAFKPDILKKNAQKAKESVQEEFYSRYTESKPALVNETISIVCYPFRLFNYNHIVGYIAMPFS